MSDVTSGISRRWLVAAAGASAGCAGLDSAGGAPARTPLEQQNEALVNEFCAAWAARDVGKLLPYLSEDIVYQMFEGRPDIVGHAAFEKELGGFLASMREVRWEILRSHAIGPLVINERIDYFFASEEKRNMTFQVAGYFLVKDGKIRVWRDFSIPGGISRIGPAVPRGS
ncbi:MAG: nuclear transport factor 2 family protein [Gammaproteobacteria bacterium]|nr:nuclear transport factor 2 family protein [Gammaproteobacteria bacterium]